jgi:DNA-binding transcriptional ArsR family regulator
LAAYPDDLVILVRVFDELRCGGQAVPREEQATPIRDAAVMRALAHPARLALLEHLGHGGPATATECADVVGLSPSAISYHLRALARAGLVEAAPGRGDGRERLWRAVAARYRVEGAADVDPEVRAAIRGLLESVLVLDEVRARRYLARVDDEPGAWQEAAFFADATLLVTADELKMIGEAVQDLLRPYRKGSRAEPPADARTVSAAIRAFPS